MTQRGVCYETYKRDLDSRNETCNKTLAKKIDYKRQKYVLYQVSLDPAGQKNMKRKGSPVKIQVHSKYSII